MTFQEWLQTEAGRMVSFEKMPRMLEIVWDARGAQNDALMLEAAQIISDLRDERDGLRRQLEQAHRFIGENIEAVES